MEKKPFVVRTREFVPSQRRIRSRPSERTIVKNITRPIITKSNNAVSRKIKPRGFDLNTVISDIITTVTRALSNPTVLLTLAIAFAVIANHDFKNKTGYIYSTFSHNTDGFSVWVIDNAKKLCGMLIFIPTLIDIPQKSRSFVAIATSLWVFLVPEYLFFEYIFQSILLHTYFKVTSKNTRIVIITLVGIAWFAGFSAFKTPQLSTTAFNSTAKMQKT